MRLQVSRGLIRADDVWVRAEARPPNASSKETARSTHSGASSLPALASISIPRRQHGERPGRRTDRRHGTAFLIHGLGLHQTLVLMTVGAALMARPS